MGQTFPLVNTTCLQHKSLSLFLHLDFLDFLWAPLSAKKNNYTLSPLGVHSQKKSARFANLKDAMGLKYGQKMVPKRYKQTKNGSLIYDGHSEHYPGFKKVVQEDVPLATFRELKHVLYRPTAGSKRQIATYAKRRVLIFIEHKHE